MKKTILEPSSFGARLSFVRRAAGMTQAKLAELVGTSQPVINRWERGKAALPGGAFLIRIGEALDCSIDWLLTGEGLVPRRVKEELEKMGIAPEQKGAPEEE